MKKSEKFADVRSQSFRTLSHFFPAINLCNTANGGCEDTCTFLGPNQRGCICRDPNSVLAGTICNCKPGYEKIGVNCLGMSESLALWNSQKEVKEVNEAKGKKRNSYPFSN